MGYNGSQANQSFSDDQELAKVLAGVSQNMTIIYNLKRQMLQLHLLLILATISLDPVARSERWSLLLTQRNLLEPVVPTPTVSTHQLQLP